MGSGGGGGPKPGIPRIRCWRARRRAAHQDLRAESSVGEGPGCRGHKIR